MLTVELRFVGRARYADVLGNSPTGARGAGLLESLPFTARNIAMSRSRCACTKSPSAASHAS